jgi:D-alanyl-D-alanine carboxypeptidase
LIREDNINLEYKVKILEDSTSNYQKSISKIREEKEAISESLKVEQANNDFFQGQIQNIASTVGVLEKLSKTDSELLEKYSKVYFLNENFIPDSLTEIPDKYLNVKNKPLQIHTKVLPYLEKMIDDAEKEKVIIQAISAYRSFGEQAYLKSSYKVTYGSGANKFSADQGYSEHQLGTTLDLTTPSVGATFSNFEKSDAYKWLAQNAYKYGFIISYPKENSYYIFEPWHFRFVGITLATRLHEQNTYFYSLDQREINKYLVNIFD